MCLVGFVSASRGRCEPEEISAYRRPVPACAKRPSGPQSTICGGIVNTTCPLASRTTDGVRRVSATRCGGKSVQRRAIPTESVFGMETPPIKLGPGASADVGYDLRRLGV